MDSKYTQAKEPKKYTLFDSLLVTLDSRLALSILMHLTICSCSKIESVQYGTGFSLPKIFQNEERRNTRHEINADEEENETLDRQTIAATLSSSTSDIIKTEKTSLLQAIYSNKDDGLASYINETKFEIMWFYVTHEELENTLGKQLVARFSRNEAEPSKNSMKCLKTVLNFCYNSFKEKIYNKDGKSYYNAFEANKKIIENPQSSFHCGGCERELKLESIAFINKANNLWYCETCKDKYVPESHQNSTLKSSVKTTQIEKNSILLNRNISNSSYIEVPMICMLNLLEIGKSKFTSGDLGDLNYLAFCIKNLSDQLKKSLSELKSNIKNQEKKEDAAKDLKIHEIFKKNRYAEIIDLHLKKMCIYNTIMWVQNDYENQYSRNSPHSLNYLVPIETLIFMLDLPGENIYDLLILQNVSEEKTDNKIQIKKNLLLFSLFNELEHNCRKNIIETISKWNYEWIFGLEEIALSETRNPTINSNTTAQLEKILQFSRFVFDENYKDLDKTYDTLKLTLLFKAFDGRITEIDLFVKRFDVLMKKKPKPSDFESLLKAYLNCENEEVKNLTTNHIEKHTLSQVITMLSFKDTAHLNWAITKKLLLNRSHEEIKLFNSIAPLLAESGLFKELEALSQSQVEDKIRVSMNEYAQLSENRNLRNSKNIYRERLNDQNTTKKDLEKNTSRYSSQVLNEFTKKKERPEVESPDVFEESVEMSSRYSSRQKAMRDVPFHESSEEREEREASNLYEVKHEQDCKRQRTSFKQKKEIIDQEPSNIFENYGTEIPKIRYERSAIYSRDEKDERMKIEEFMKDNLKSSRNSFQQTIGSKKGMNTRTLEELIDRNSNAEELYPIIPTKHEKKEARQPRNSFQRHTKKEDDSVNISAISPKLESVHDANNSLALFMQEGPPASIKRGSFHQSKQAK